VILVTKLQSIFSHCFTGHQLGLKHNAISQAIITPSLQAYNPHLTNLSKAHASHSLQVLHTLATPPVM
jgi:hypothetical protein